jgi:hypothetical protein
MRANTLGRHDRNIIKIAVNTVRAASYNIPSFPSESETIASGRVTEDGELRMFGIIGVTPLGEFRFRKSLY